jgi:hypothetical protein
MREPDVETKAAMMIAELALERALHEWEARWVLCYSGEGDFDSQDCACCLTWEDINGCGCECHARIRELKGLFSCALGFYDDIMRSWMVGRHVTGKKNEGG